MNDTPDRQEIKNSKRIQWLRDYYFLGNKRKWNNEYTSWSTGTPWDLQYHEFTYYIVPETYLMFDVMRGDIPRLPEIFHWKMIFLRKVSWKDGPFL